MEQDHKVEVLKIEKEKEDKKQCECAVHQMAHQIIQGRPGITIDGNEWIYSKDSGVSRQKLLLLACPDSHRKSLNLDVLFPDHQRNLLVDHLRKQVSAPGNLYIRLCLETHRIAVNTMVLDLHGHLPRLVSYPHLTFSMMSDPALPASNRILDRSFSDENQAQEVAFMEAVRRLVIQVNE